MFLSLQKRAECQSVHVRFSGSYMGCCSSCNLFVSRLCQDRFELIEFDLAATIHVQFVDHLLDVDSQSEVALDDFH